MPFLHRVDSGLQLEEGAFESRLSQAQMMAAACLCGFVPMQIAFILLDSTGDEVINGHFQTCVPRLQPHMLLSRRVRVSDAPSPRPRGGHT